MTHDDLKRIALECGMTQHYFKDGQKADGLFLIGPDFAQKFGAAAAHAALNELKKRVHTESTDISNTDEECACYYDVEDMIRALRTELENTK